MGRQQQQQQQQHNQQRERSTSGADLLNFHFNTGPSAPSQPSQPNNNNNNNNNRRRNQHNHNNNNHHQNNHSHRRRNQQPQERRKPVNSHLFNLHSSADHAFVITRHGLKQQQYSFSGSDEPVSWESVRMVKYLIPAAVAVAVAATTGPPTNIATTTTACCPICLDDLVCPRITKCGHFYCLPCLLRHVQIHAQSNPYTHVKCPCCGVPLHVADLRPLLLVSAMPPKLHQRMTLVKLHITKDCPAPYLPRPNAVRRSSIHAAPSMNDPDARYCRFNYVDPAIYQEHLATNKVELEMELSNLMKQQDVLRQQLIQRQRQQQQLQLQRQQQQMRRHPAFGPPPNTTTATTTTTTTTASLKPTPMQQYRNHQMEIEAIFLTSSLDIVKKEIQKSIQEFQQEQELAESYASPGSGIAQHHHPQHLIASNYEVTKLPPFTTTTTTTTSATTSTADAAVAEAPQGAIPTNISADMQRFRGESFGSEGDSLGARENLIHSGSNVERPRGESTCSEEATGEKEQRYRGYSFGSYASIDENDHCESVQSHGDGTMTEASSVLVPGSPTTTSQQQQQQQKLRGSTTSSKQQRRSSNTKRHHEFPKASMYLDNEGSAHFYQSEDGQLYFLSRFNISCLLNDFSLKVPDYFESEQQQSLNYWQRRKLLPLPDIVEGEILEIETINLTPENRKRMPYLQHLPLYTDVHFVELDLNSLLSMDTKRKFKADFEKRRKRRQSKVKAEKREDKIARKKEEERINELKARMQQVDPNDEFFQISPPPEEPDMTGEAFGPAISGGAAPARSTPAAARSNPAFSFSNVCQSGGAFPALSATAESNFPALGSSPPSRRAPQQSTLAWGSPTRSSSGRISNNNHAAAIVTPVSPSVQIQVTEVPKQPPPMPGGSKKKGKGKKIVLFSTGGQRGPSY